MDLLSIGFFKYELISSIIRGSASRVVSTIQTIDKRNIIYYSVSATFVVRGFLTGTLSTSFERERAKFGRVSEIRAKRLVDPFGVHGVHGRGTLLYYILEKRIEGGGRG